MRPLYSQGLSLFLSVLLVSLPISGGTAELIGVAKATGPAEVNGLPFPGETTLYSGDRVSTGQESHLTLFTNPQERVYIAASSSARLFKHGEATVVALEQGTVAFRASGHTYLTLNEYDVTIRSQSDAPAVAQVTLSKERGAQVQALKGAIEVAAPSQSVLLQPEQVAVISDATAQEPLILVTEGGPSAPAQQSAKAPPGSLTGTVLDRTNTVVRGATVTLTSETGVTYTVQTSMLGEFTFNQLPAGRYTLRISGNGFNTYETSNVVVEGGRETSLGLVTLQRGVSGKKPAIVIVVIAGVAAAVAIPLALGGDGDGQVVSPSTP